MESFSTCLFRHFEVRRIICNIDPIFGSETDGEECVQIIRKYDPRALIFMPKKKGYTEAVARIWAATTSVVFLHLEDDWILNRNITPADIEAFNDPTVGQICFNHANKNWDQRKGEDCYGRRRYRLLGLPTPFKWKHAVFTVSPTFVQGDFGRRCADLLDPAFDPEKQFFKAVNRDLENYVFAYKNKVLGRIGDFAIEDIGRSWRESRNIEKRIVNWQSEWHHHSINAEGVQMPPDATQGLAVSIGREGVQDNSG